MSNFDFLSIYKDEPFLHYATTAEENLYQDSNLTLSRCRQLSESLAKYLAKQHKILVGTQPIYQDLINQLTNKLNLSPKISQSFHKLRQNGNQAVHNNEADLELAKQSLKISFDLMTWFHQTYGLANLDFEPQPFIIPIQPSVIIKPQVIEVPKPIIQGQTSFKDIKPLAIGEIALKVESEKLRKQKLADYQNALVNHKFLKFDLRNQLLPANAKQWALLLDIYTGSMWANNWNVDDDFPVRDGLTWFKSDEDFCQSNLVATYNDGNNTETWLNTINHHGWCGFHDWQIPSELELQESKAKSHLWNKNNSKSLEKKRLVVRRDVLNSKDTCDVLKGMIIDKIEVIRKIEIQKKREFKNQRDKGTVIDRKTKLMWAKNLSQSDSFPVCQSNWFCATEVVERMNIQCWAGYDDWRLPSIEELKTLLIFHAFNEKNKGKFFWSSSHVSNNDNDALGVELYSTVRDSNKSSIHYVRAVRSFK